MWARLNDKANGDEKLLALSDPAWRLWGCGLIYCQDKLSDGFLPDYVLPTFGLRQAPLQAVIEELCAVLVPGKGPLWHRVPGGFQIHDYLDWNDSKAQILANRYAGRQRLEMFRNPGLRQRIRDRDGDRCRYCSATVCWGNRRGPLGGTYDHVVPDGGSTFDHVVVACRG
jgi:hypothetical protein